MSDNLTIDLAKYIDIKSLPDISENLQCKTITENNVDWHFVKYIKNNLCESNYKTDG